MAVLALFHEQESPPKCSRNKTRMQRVRVLCKRARVILRSPPSVCERTCTYAAGKLTIRECLRRRVGRLSNRRAAELAVQLVSFHG